MKPILKYRGGKAKELKYFLPYIQKHDRYIEPFLGGGALFFHLEPEHAIINDINERLSGFYQEIAEQWEEAKKQLSGLALEYKENQEEYEKRKKECPGFVENRNEELYYRIRDEFNHKREPEYLDSVLYFFLNKTAYSGMIRYNKGGRYNVPFGRYKNFNVDIITDEHIKLLQKAEILSMDYKKIFNMEKEGDFFFLDPPYDCIWNDYGNKAYKDGFGEEEQRRLANDFQNLSAKTLMVIGKTKLTEELYQGKVLTEYEKHYAVNIKNRFQSESRHMIVTNFRREKDA